jgi:hypothetical protein
VRPQYSPQNIVEISSQQDVSDDDSPDDNDDGAFVDQQIDSISIASSKSSIRIEDSLIQKGQSYAERQKELKRHHDMKVQAEMTGRPQLTPYAEKLYREKGHGRDTGDIAVRSRIQLERKKEKEKAIREQLELQDRQQV